MGKTEFLSQKKRDYVESRKSVLELRKQELDYERLKKKEKEEQTLGKLKTGFFKSITPSKDKRAFNPQRLRPTQDFSPAQRMFQEVLGGSGEMWGTGQNLPKINNSLNKGNGLINSGDQGETGNLFGLRR